MPEDLVQITDTQNLVPTGLQNPLAHLMAHFPFPTIRPTQERAISVMARSLEDGTPFSIIEAPTGVGKSGLSIALGRYMATLPALSDDHMPGSYLLTSQKSLTAQLLRDFEQYGLVEMKGKSNYSCVAHDTNCDEGSTLNRLQTATEKRQKEEAAEGGGYIDADAADALPTQARPEEEAVAADKLRQCKGNCPYAAAKDIFMTSPLGVTNYSYFMVETAHVKQLKPRRALVLDEAHNVEREVIGMVDIQITKKRIEELRIAKIPHFEPKDESKAVDWINKTLMPAAKLQLLKYSNQILQLEMNSLMPAKDREQLALRLQRKKGSLSSFCQRIGQYSDVTDRRNWISWTDKNGELNIKPLSGADWAHQMLFQYAPNILMLSATILDFKTFERNLGISPGDAARFQCPSEFPEANRPIIYWPVGSMSYRDIEGTLPNMCRRVERILDYYPKFKGVIHTHTYRINSTLVEHLKRTQNKYRIITHSSEAGSREAAVQEHCSSPDPTVLMSPSMTEGLDLKGDLSRFQIVCKVPYPFLDTYTRARMERDPAWYQLQTALCLVQGTGRSIRSMDDYATTFILDSAFEKFLLSNQDILPDWWKESITFK